MRSPTDEALLAELGEQLSRLRKRHHLTQEALAREAGISRRTLLRLEAGESVQLTKLVRVLRVFGVLDEVLAALGPPVSPLAELRAERELATAPEDEPWTWGDE